MANITKVRQKQRNTTVTTERFSVGNSDFKQDTPLQLQPAEVGVNETDGTIELGIVGDVLQIPSIKMGVSEDGQGPVWDDVNKKWIPGSVSGNADGVIFNAIDRDPDTGNPAVEETRNGQKVLAFDPDVDNSVIFSGALTGYNGNGLNCVIVWVAKTATSGRTRWNLAIERSEGGVTNIDVDSFAGGNSLFTGTTNGTNGVINYNIINFADGPNMDDLSNGERFRIKLVRDADHPSDDMLGFAQFMQLIITET